MSYTTRQINNNSMARRIALNAAASGLTSSQAAFLYAQRLCKTLCAPQSYAMLLPNAAKNGTIINMKKLSVILLVIAALCLFVPCMDGTACAADNQYRYEFTFGKGTEDETTLVLQTVTYNDKPAGVRYANYYFGNSGIPVVVDIYSSDELPLDFAIGAADLSAEQLSARSRVEALVCDIHRRIVHIDSVANTQYDGSDRYGNVLSDIYRYNNAAMGEQLQIDPDTYRMLQIAQEMYTVTGGAYDPAVYRLVDLWGFSSRIYSMGNFGLPYDRVVEAEQFFEQGYPLPADKYVKAFSDSAFTDFSANAVVLQQVGDTYTVTKNVAPAVVDGASYQQWLDLGGVAKGYVADVVKAMLREMGLSRFNVDAGSSSLTFGLGVDGDTTRLGLTDAFDPLSALFQPVLCAVDVAECDVSVSGQNVRKYTVDGVEYSHIIDGSSGAPARTGIRSVAIIAPEQQYGAAKGDCLTTALTVMGRDGLVDFVNGYIKDNGIKLLAQYESTLGNRFVLSNLDGDSIVEEGENFDSYKWALRQDEGVYRFDDSLDVAPSSTFNYIWALYVGAGIVAAAFVGLIIYRFVRRASKGSNAVKYVRKDKPFKVGDIVLYISLALLIAVLVMTFVFDDKSDIKVIRVMDDDAQQVLFVYNVAQGDYEINYDNLNGWQIAAERQDNALIVRFSRLFDGEERFNTVRISLDGAVSVLMEDSLCGFQQDCVRHFPAIEQSGGAIVCAPNRLKIVTE